jgi:hypothetical protein
MCLHSQIRRGRKPAQEEGRPDIPTAESAALTRVRKPSQELPQAMGGARESMLKRAFLWLSGDMAVATPVTLASAVEAAGAAQPRGPLSVCEASSLVREAAQSVTKTPVAWQEKWHPALARLN